METPDANKNGTSQPSLRFLFDGFEVKPSERICAQNGLSVPLTGKAFDVLLAFVENPGRLLGKDEMMELIWKDEFVEEGNLTRNISTLRRALGDNGKKHKYIATVQGHGYRFLPDVSKVLPKSPAIGEQESGAPLPVVAEPVHIKAGPASARWILSIVTAAILLTAAWLGTERFRTPTQIKTLAVLPLRSIDPGDNYLGIGIADAVIRKISQAHQLTVRPTSAVLHYAKEDKDALTAARELSADAVLDGAVQRSGDRLRVGINLLRTTDGSSLWAENFEMASTDVFAIQDKVAQLVATRLQLHIDPAQKTGLDNKYPASPTAYEFYIKGIFSLDQRGNGIEALPQMQETIAFFNKSIEADPDYAMAHAQLAWAYVWTAHFIDMTNTKWADLARQEIKQADELDPQIAETHLAKAMTFWSSYGGYQNEAAIRELLAARRLNPNTGHCELAGIFGHLGLAEQASAELQNALVAEPFSKSLKDLTLILPSLRGDADVWLDAQPKIPSGLAFLEPWYYLRKGQLDNAKKAIDERLARTPSRPRLLAYQALYLAQSGNFQEAELLATESIANVPPGDQQLHHLTYDAACVYALAGNSAESVKWLRDTANTGFPNYPLFASDPYLDRIRNSPKFIQFLIEQKAQWERFQHEAGEQ